MFGKKKKKDIQVIGKQEGERQSNINEPKYKIIVYKNLGRDVYQEIDNFHATQKKDSSGSMFLVNEEHNFKESLAISKEENVLKLKERLDIKKLPLEKQREALDNKIIEQEERIRNIENGIIKHVIKNKGEDDKVIEEKVNSIEENKKLKQLKVLKYVINHSQQGSYDSIDGQGFRQRFYLYDEGALIPMFWDRKTSSLYTAVDTRIKFYKADQDLINADFADENRDKWAKIGKGLMMLMFVVLFVALIYWGIQLNERSSELDARSTAMAQAIEGSNFGQCIGQISSTNKELLKIIDEYRAENNVSRENNINSVNTDLT